jgi:hypothetical protein
MYGKSQTAHLNAGLSASLTACVITDKGLVMNYISKDYFIQYNIGKVKYCLSYFIGNRYEDGSKRYEIKTFKSKKALNSFIKTGE